MLPVRAGAHYLGMGFVRDLTGFAHAQATIQYNTIQYNTMQYNKMQYNTIQHSTIQYNTTQYNNNVSHFQPNLSLHQNQHFDESLDIADKDCEEVPSQYNTPRSQRGKGSNHTGRNQNLYFLFAFCYVFILCCVPIILKKFPLVSTTLQGCSGETIAIILGAIRFIFPLNAFCYVFIILCCVPVVSFTRSELVQYIKISESKR